MELQIPTALFWYVDEEVLDYQIHDLLDAIESLVRRVPCESVFIVIADSIDQVIAEKIASRALYADIFYFQQIPTNKTNSCYRPDRLDLVRSEVTDSVIQVICIGVGKKVIPEHLSFNAYYQIGKDTNINYSRLVDNPTGWFYTIN